MEGSLRDRYISGTAVKKEVRYEKSVQSTGSALCILAIF